MVLKYVLSKNDVDEILTNSMSGQLHTSLCGLIVINMAMNDDVSKEEVLDIISSSPKFGSTDKKITCNLVETFM